VESNKDKSSDQLVPRVLVIYIAKPSTQTHDVEPMGNWTLDIAHSICKFSVDLRWKINFQKFLKINPWLSKKSFGGVVGIPDIGWEAISDSNKIDLIMIAMFMAINGPRGLGVQVKVPRISIQI
jgi:hypothetical protein